MARGGLRYLEAALDWLASLLVITTCTFHDVNLVSNLPKPEDTESKFVLFCFSPSQVTSRVSRFEAKRTVRITTKRDEIFSKLL